MSDENPRLCESCRTPIPDDAPRGQCPQCLFPAGGTVESQGQRGQLPGSVPADEIDAYLPDFEVEELIGFGGMGTVYKARQIKLKRSVAIKILPFRSRHNPTFVERFRREAQAMAQLNHTNIVTIHDYGEADDLLYLVMEFVDGTNLAKLMRSGKVSAQESLSIVAKLCDALQYAHDRGIVHRDIKPSNILLDPEGVVKIADFGIAKLIDVGTEYFTLTQEGQGLGTPFYMAPEQRVHPEEADHRADIYSLGVVFYEMLTGQLPVGRFAPPSRKANTDLRLDKIVLKALSEEPDRRYQHASDIKSRVEKVDRDSKPLSKKVEENDSRDLTTVDVNDSQIRSKAPDSLNSLEGPLVNDRSDSSWSKQQWVGAMSAALLTTVAVVTYLMASNNGSPSDKNHALRFNGFSSHVVVPSLTISGTNPFTIECFAIVTGFNEHATLVSNGPIRLKLHETRRWEALVLSEINDNGDRFFSSAMSEPLVVGKLYHVAMTYDGSNLALYVDGHPSEEQAENVQFVPTEQSFVIGASYGWESQDLGRFYHGLIDEIRFSDVARYNGSFSPPDKLVPDQDTIALYHMDEGVGTVTRDVSGNKNHGTIVDAVWAPLPD